MLLLPAGGAAGRGTTGRHHRITTASGSFASGAILVLVGLLAATGPVAAQARIGGPALAPDGPVSLVDEEEARRRTAERGATADAGSDGASDASPNEIAADLERIRDREARPLGAGRDPAPLDAIGRMSATSDTSDVLDDADAGPGTDEAASGGWGWSDLTSDGGSGAWDVIRTVGALAVVIAIAFVVRTGVRRVAGPLAGGSRPSGVLEVLARYPVGRGQHLVLLKVGRRVLVLHQAGSSMRTLSEVSDPTEVAALLGRMEAGARDRDAGRFRARLGEFERDLTSDGDRTAADGARREPTRRGPGSVAREDLPAPVRERTESDEVIDLTRRRRRGMVR